MRLTDGVLDARLDDNLLRVSRLAFDSPLAAGAAPVATGRRRGAGKIDGRPGRLEIAGQMRVDRSNEGATLDLRLDRVGVYQLPDRWMMVSGDGSISWLPRRWRSAAAWRSMRLTGRWRRWARRGFPTTWYSGGRWHVAPGAFRPRLDLDLETISAAISFQRARSGNPSCRQCPPAAPRAVTCRGRAAASARRTDVSRPSASNWRSSAAS